MEVKAQLNGLRLAPRKVRLVVGLVKKKDVDTALNQLTHLSNRASRPVAKLIRSAIANAEHNYRMVRSNLYVKNAWVDEGRTLRRWLPKGFGRAGRIQKKTSHVNVVLDERIAGIRAQAPAKKEATAAPEPSGDKAEQARMTEPAEQKKPATPASPKHQRGEKQTEEVGQKPKGLKGFGKRFFRRKSI